MIFMANLSHNFTEESASSAPKKGFWNFFGRHKPKKEIADDFRYEKKSVADYAEMVKREKSARRFNAADKPQDKQNKPDKSVPENTNKNTNSKPLPKISGSWDAPSILKTNLVKGEPTTFIDWRRNITGLSIAAGTAVLAVLILYGWLIFWQKSATRKVQALSNEITELKNVIASTKGTMNQINAFHRRLNFAGRLLNRHIYWTNFFKFLEENILPDVYLSPDFSANPLGEYSFSALTKSYGRIADQVRVLRANKNIVSVSVGGGSLVGSKSNPNIKGDMIGFTLEFKIKPEIFYK